MSVDGPLVLIILDGWGSCTTVTGNAIVAASTPHLDELFAKYPVTTLVSSGEEVGLPRGQMGNSEVGHLNLGAGRIVDQDLTRISKAVRDGSFYDNPVLLESMEKVRERNSALHLMGLLSDGGVHSHVDHLYALLELARDQGLKRVYVHTFLDGRDVPPANARIYLQALEQRLDQLACGTIATVTGRYYAMDRDGRWERVQAAFGALVQGEGIPVPSALAALEQAYERGETDEFVQPSVVRDAAGAPVGRIAPGDGVIFFNFRPDRARQLTRAFVDETFDGFPRPGGYPGVHFVCLTQYDKTIEAPVAFRPQVLMKTLGEVLSYHQLKQLRLAETEKYAHVTFFFNGGVEKPNPGEDRVLIPSPRVATYDLQPAMSAVEVTDVLVAHIREKGYDVIIVNYANPDMVGHTGVMSAAQEAVATVDRCVGRVIKALREYGGTALITADHGNAECMIDVACSDGDICTAHTTNPVPFILVSDKHIGAPLRRGTLRDVAPTMLQLLGIAKPEDMTGSSLLEA